MKAFRAAVGNVTGIICAGFLQSCGGGYHAGSGSMTPTSISISVKPTTVIAGRSTAASTLYDGNGAPQPAAGPLIVNLAAGLIAGWSRGVDGTHAVSAGLGHVDICDTNGKLIKQLVAGGALNAPWGLALAPADFGTFSNTLLVGNFGGGKINAYDAAAGTPLGVLVHTNSSANGAPGLLGIAFGNDAANEPHNTLFFASRINSGADGVYRRIELTTP